MNKVVVAVVGAVFAVGSLAGCQEPPAPSATPVETQVVKAALNASPKTSDFIFEAQNSIALHSAPLTVDGGDVGARGTGTGPFLAGGVAIDIASGVKVQATRSIIADSIKLNTGIVVGALQVNRLVNPTSGTHGTVTALVPLPALPALAAVSPGTQNLNVTGTTTANPGKYQTVTMGTNGVLKLKAGTYEIKDLTGGTKSRIEALGPVQIRIANRFKMGSSFSIGPASGVTLTAKDIRIEVSGKNGTDGALSSTPKAAVLDTGGCLRALILVPNGTLSLASKIDGKGAFMARDIDVGSEGAKYTKEDGFPNAASCTTQSCNDSNPCTTDVCGTNGLCTNTKVAAGTSCADGNGCNGAETCNASGVCQAGAPVTCTASDQCHVAGTCDSATGTCSNPTKSNGTTCTDGNACSQADTCQAGVCAGGNVVACTAQDQCHVAGTCNPTTGTCSNPVKANGTACSDGSACTQADTCQAGTCTGGSPVICVASDQCHAPGFCDPASGACTNPPAPNGAACSDGNACTTADTCVAGACTGGSPVTCTPSDQCHLAGTCNPGTGTCSNPVKPNGAACTDGNACTPGDICEIGVCKSGTVLPCTAMDQCHAVGTCNPGTGTCSNPTKPNGTTCSDNDACTTADTCVAGACTPGAAVTCTASDECHDVGTCNSATGQCSDPTKPNGTTCSDNDACTQADTCVAGACTGGNAVTCVASDECHDPGTCDPANGTCSKPDKPNGTTCSDDDACTQADTCVAGACTPGTAVTCTAQDQCHNAGTCNPANGMCSNPAKANGASCNDNNACTQTDACQAGECAGGNPVTCTAQDQCHAPGTCNPSNGTCSNPQAPNGTVCSDGDACTASDACSAGVCAGTGSCGQPGVTIVNMEDPEISANPILTMTMTTPVTRVAPRGPFDVTATVTYDSVAIYMRGRLSITNNGTSTFTVPGLSNTVEYFSATTNTWVPLMDVRLDASANLLPVQTPHSLGFDSYPLSDYPNGFDGDPVTLVIPGVTYSPSYLIGTTIAPGATLPIIYESSGRLPAGAERVLFERTQSTAVRNVIRFDAAPGLEDGDSLEKNLLPLPVESDLARTGLTGKMFTDFTAANYPLTSTSSAPLLPGDTMVFTSTPLAAAISPRSDYLNDSIYLSGLAGDATYRTFQPRGFVVAANGGSASASTQALGWLIPIVQAAKSGPAIGIAGALIPYSVALNNTGNTPATDVSITDTVVGTPVVNVAGPASLNAGASTATTVNFQTDPTRPAGPLKDTASVTWHDSVGNVYGPIATSFTTTLTAGNPNGYLVLSADTTVPRVAESVTLTVQARSPIRQPAPGVTVQLKVTGANAATFTGVTGADGAVTFPYIGSLQGTDVTVASATIANGVGLSSNALTLVWQRAACVNRAPDDVAPVPNAGPDQRAAIQSTAPSPTFTMQRISTGFNNPIGIDYHGPTNKMIVSVNYPNGEPHTFELVNRDGTRQKFSNIHGLTDEVYFAIARDVGNGKNLGGFLDGELLTGTGVPGDIARISPDGSSIVNPWVHLPGETGRLRGMLHFDTTGLYGGDLLITTLSGRLWRVTSGGQATLITTLPPAEHEGLCVIPNNPTKFGPFAGKILIGTENSVIMRAVALDGTVTTHDLGIGIENIMIVPPHENFFGVDWGSARLYGASASQFNGMVGDLLLTEEYGGRLFNVHWNGTAFVKTLLFQAATWEHTAFGPAGMVEIAPVGVALAGTVTDKGCPEGAVVTASWSVLSGPGAVTFSDAHTAETTASFSNEGTYVLRLTAANGTYTSFDDTTVVISKTGLPNVAPVVNAGADQTVRLPNAVDLAGSATDDGVPVGSSLALSWSEVSGPAPMTFVNSTAGFTTALFAQAGTYVLRLTATDGDLSSTDNVTVTVTPEPDLTGASLGVALASAGPLPVGASETLIATLTDSTGHPIPEVPIYVSVAGANNQGNSVTTDAAGMARFTYTGAAPGTDVLSAVTQGSTVLASSQLSVTWTSGSFGPTVTQGWIGSPAHQSTVMGLVPIKVADGVTLTAATVRYWPAATPTRVTTLPTTPGGPGATLATLDTTMLANGGYIVDLDATNTGGQAQHNLVLLTVGGEYKPGRVVVEVTDMTIPAVGMPLTVGRRYDSLEKDNVGDFGRGWSLSLGHPKLEVDAAHNVTITMPDNRRVTFGFTPTFPGAGPVVFGFLLLPAYTPGPGLYGSLTADGCPVLAFNPYAEVPMPTCFGAFDPSELPYAPTTYTYTDPYGREFVMGATGELKSIRDRQHNVLTFSAGGIMSNSGPSITFERDALGRITKVTSPAIDVGGETVVHRYEYDAAGDLKKCILPDGANSQYTYEDHRLLTTKDPRGNFERTSTYHADGRLETDTDAVGNVTRYTYDLAIHKTTTTNPDLGTVQQTFDDRGLLLNEVDPLGRKTEHTYDVNHNELTRKNALDEVTTFTYDAKGNKKTIANVTSAGTETTSVTYDQFSLPVTNTDPTGYTTTITYDEVGVPINFRDPIGTLAAFSTSARGLPLSATDAAGNTAYMSYDSAGNLGTRLDRLGRMTRHTYDGVGRRTATTDARGGVTRDSYVLRGPRSRHQDAAGNVTRFQYDANLNPIREEGDLGRFTAYEYNGLNHLTKVTHADLTTIEYTRDFRGNPLTMKDEAGRTTRYEYDKAGQLTKTIFADDSFTTREYDELGRLATATDERGNPTRYEYEPGCGCAERVTKATDGLNRSTVTTYDAAGRRASVTDAAGHTTTYAYDDRGQLKKTTYADQTSETDGYDTRGRHISHTDQMGSVTRYDYDAEGQLISVTDMLTKVTYYAYDDNGNLRKVTDANDHTTSYEYDALNRKIKRALPLGMFETFAYNAYGDNTSHVDFQGKATTMTHDTRSRLLTKAPDPTLGEPPVTFTYNPTGTRATMSDASGPTTYAYDRRNRLLTKATPAGTLTYTYDPAGNVATIRSSNANGAGVNYAWDDANQLVSVGDDHANGVTTSAFTATGRPSTLTQPSGVGASYSYDARDRVTSLAWQRGANPAFGSWSYGFNLRGQRTAVTDVTGRHVAYGYDAVSRLESETITNDPRGAVGNGELSYSLDPTGNRLSRASSLAAIATTTYGYDANDRLGTSGYDANGNTTTADGHTYAYDFENRLVSKDGGAVTIVYDGDGNRVAKTVGGVTTRYLVDDLNPTGYLQVLEEVSGGAVRIAYTYGTMVVSQRRVAAGGAMSYYGYDAHGNVAFLTDATGTVTDAYDYDAWGLLLASTGNTPNTRLYSGEELDPDVGLINLRARQYEPETGRFLTGDPELGEPGLPRSIIRYSYASGDPINGSDPTGRVTLFEDSLHIEGITWRIKVMLHGLHHPFVKAGGWGLFCAHIQLGAGVPYIFKEVTILRIVLPFCKIARLLY